MLDVMPRPSSSIDRVPLWVIGRSALDRQCVCVELAADERLKVETAGFVSEVPDLPNVILMLLHSGQADENAWLIGELDAINALPQRQPCIVLLDQEDALARLPRPIRVEACLLSSIGFETLASAIQTVASGLCVLSPEVLVHWLDPTPSAEPLQASVLPAHPVSDQRGGWLTRRQSQVARLLVKGYSNRQIADVLGLSESTVKVHIRTLMSTFGVSNRTQIVSRMLLNERGNA